MSSPPKRPAPPVPDPNWEVELHGPSAAARRAPPESRDELLAHAVLREPEPLDLIDDFADLERVTMPPPAGMDDHVARMMAEAALLEDVDNEGDRPTPLCEVDPIPFAASGKGRPADPPRATSGGVPRAPLAGARPVQAPRPAPRTPTPPPFAAPRRASAHLPAPATPLPFAAVPAPKRSATPPPFAVVRPVDPAPRRTLTPAPVRAPLRTPTPAPMSAPTPAPFAIRQRDPVVRPASARPAEGMRRISSLDIEDLPAVFSLDGLSLDEPASERGAPGVSAPSNVPVISPSPVMPPSSGPAISAPFASMEPMDLAAELFDPDLSWGDLPVAPPPEAPRDVPSDGPPPETLAAIEARLSAGDYGRALVLAEAALDQHPDHPILRRSADTCRDELYKRYLQRLGAADHVPRVAMQSGALTGLTLDHRAGFLLSCVDGDSTVEEIIDVSAMPKLEAVRVLYELLQEGVIEMTARR